MIEKLVRNNIRALKPYTSARDMYSKGVLLDANENGFGSVVDFAEDSLNRYPDPHQKTMREKLGTYLGVSPQKLFFGVGSDEVIDLLIRIFCEPNRDEILVLEPTYGMYQVCADINAVKTNIALLQDDFSIDAAETLKQITPQTKLIFLCSPNNPTANLLKKESIAEILQRTDSIVVVDEAYIDFADEKGSCISLIHDYPNLVILRTFSKAWGLAGIRLGYCIANEIIIDYLFKVKAPYNINALTRAVFHKAFDNLNKKDEMIALIIKERAFVIGELQTIARIQKIYPSDTNYVLFRINHASAIQKLMAEKGVVIRDRSTQAKLADSLRITIGTREENEKFLSTFQDVLSEIKE